VLNGLIVFSSGIGSLLVRKSIERRTRTDSPKVLSEAWRSMLAQMPSPPS